MGIICILLGAITFLGFIYAGVLLANTVISYKALLSATLTTLTSVPDNSVRLGIICFFAFIGLLIGLNLVMHGLTYGKVSRLYRMANRARKR